MYGENPLDELSLRVSALEARRAARYGSVSSGRMPVGQDSAVTFVFEGAGPAAAVLTVECASGTVELTAEANGLPVCVRACASAGGAAQFAFSFCANGVTLLRAVFSGAPASDCQITVHGTGVMLPEERRQLFADKADNAYWLETGGIVKCAPGGVKTYLLTGDYKFFSLAEPASSGVVYCAGAADGRLALCVPGFQPATFTNRADHAAIATMSGNNFVMVFVRDGAVYTRTFNVWGVPTGAETGLNAPGKATHVYGVRDTTGGEFLCKTDNGKIYLYGGGVFKFICRGTGAEASAAGGPIRVFASAPSGIFEYGADGTADAAPVSLGTACVRVDAVGLVERVSGEIHIRQG